MSRDGLARMDVDTKLLYHRRIRALQRIYPTLWPTYLAAYLALLGEAWGSCSREITLEDSWCPAIPCELGEAQAALTAVGLVDPEGTIPADSWSDWFLPVHNRAEAARAKGRAGAAARWGSNHPQAKPEHSLGNAPSSHPSRHPSIKPTRAGATLKELVKFDEVAGEYVSVEAPA